MTAATGNRFAVVREDLHRRYDATLEPAEIDGILDRAIEEVSSRSRIDVFVPIMVEREATEIIEETLRDNGVAAPNLRGRKEVLFVCERNAGRSQLASAIMRNLTDDAVFVRSVGLHPEGGIDAHVIDVLEERGMRTDFLYQKEIVPRVVHRADVVVLMGVDEIPGVPGARYEHWDIEDPHGKSLDEVRAIADAVQAKVEVLAAELGAVVMA